MKPIVLTTFNARYSHTSIGLRCLYANLKELRPQAVIEEFVIHENVQAIAERILKHAPKIVGIGVYIWNAEDVAELIALLKKISPDTRIVLGGPEASHQPFRVNLDPADYIIRFEGEKAFYELCRTLLEGETPPERIITAPAVDLASVELPYAHYSDHDVANRHLYVEASRGCPFLCEFCLSSLDEKVRYVPLERLLDAFETLWERGARHFRFIDRTFNLDIRTANALMDFFLAKPPPYFLHFEVIPDHFPESLKTRIAQFPPGALQLEVGIQTLNPDVAETIRRPLKLEKIERNLRFIETQTHAHMHLDLIVGLPGESLERFGQNLDRLCALSGSEIQIGILKKLSGTTLSRHDELHGMVYSDVPPYDVLRTADVDFFEIQAMKRFARFWDLLYNSGNFPSTMRLLFDGGSVFGRFFALSEWIYTRTESTWKISLERLGALLFEYLSTCMALDASQVAQTMAADLTRVKGRGLPPYLRPYVTARRADAALSPDPQTARQARRREP